MIINKKMHKEGLHKINIPLSYEYDSDSNSVVLLKGYRYEIMYDRTKTKDIVDLRNYSEKPPV